MKGRVVSTKMNKTVAVLVERVARHPLYKKTFVRSKRYLVDDQMGVKEGDIVEIIKIRPISKNKHWKVLKVVGKNLEEMTEAVLKEAAKKTIAEVMPETPEESENSENRIKSENQGVREPIKKISKTKKQKGGKQTEVVVDDLAEKAKK